MPYLRVSISGPETEQTTNRVVNKLMHATTTILGKQEDVIAIDVNFTPSNQWFVGGQTVEQQNLRTYFLEINVTEGTNTRSEKAQFIKTVFADMTEILGPLAEASYVIVRDVDSDAWGYGGKTQEYRYIKP